MGNKKSEKKNTSLKKRIQKGGIKRQLYRVYIFAGVIPLTIIGIFLLINTYSMFKSYNEELLESYNRRVATTLFEITTQTYNISGKLAYDKDLWNLLSNNYSDESDEEFMIDNLKVIDDYNYDYTAIDSIEIYCDNDTFKDYENFFKVTDDIEEKSWYQKAISQSSAFWVSMETSDENDNISYNLSLVRKIPLVDSDYHAVLVMRLSSNYLNMRLLEENYISAISVSNLEIAFCSEEKYLGINMDDIAGDQDYTKFLGLVNVEGRTDLVCITKLSPYHSDSEFYICTINEDAYMQIRKTLTICMLIIIFSILIPAISIHFFSNYFADRIKTLKNALHKVSGGDYNIPDALSGDDEVSEAFTDLVIATKTMQEQKEKVYESALREKELEKQYEETKFKVLAGQINPHFLYNTLETIRMKAFKAKDREVATAIKTLGKILRYVLDNNGMKKTNLTGALDYISNYLSIQKLRFGDRINYEINVDDSIDKDRTYILPLLIQPLIENAIIHGLDEVEENGKVTVNITRDKGNEDILIIDVIDNGCGISKENLEKLLEKLNIDNEDEKRSIGLKNVYKRVTMSYGEPFGMEIKSEGEGMGTSVRLLLPFDIYEHNV